MALIYASQRETLSYKSLFRSSDVVYTSGVAILSNRRSYHH
jgi:hypothetical protein